MPAALGESSLRPRTFPPRRKNCPPRSRGASAARHRVRRDTPSRSVVDVSRTVGRSVGRALDRRRRAPRVNAGWTIRGTRTHRGQTRLNRLGSGRLLRRGPYGGAAQRKATETSLLEREGGYPHQGVGHPFHPRPRGHGPYNAEGRFAIYQVSEISVTSTG